MISADVKPVGTDTALVVYGVLDPAALADGSSVLTRYGLTLVEDGPLAVVVGTDLPERARDGVVRHAEVLDTLAAECPVVPVRFGTVVPDADTVVEELLAPRVEGLRAQLEHLAGRRQHRFRATFDENELLARVVGSDPTIAELRRRTSGVPEEASYADRVRLGELVARQVEQRSAQAADELLAAVLPLVADHAVREHGGLRYVLDVALLVDREQESELETRLEELARDREPLLRLSLAGPMAAYDFVGEL